MKKLITLILGIAFVYSCSTSSDGNGNSNTTVVPVAPSNLTGTVASTTQINLSWTDNSTNETGFKIERKSGTGTYAVIGTTATDITTFSDTGLTPYTTYTYKVYSNNAVGNSLTYSNEFTITVVIPTITDIDGNVYQAVSICNQIWSQSNLKVSKYTDGTTIPQVTDKTQWANMTTGAWCYPTLDPTGEVYGKLYNWYAIMGIYDSNSAANPSLRKKLVPVGWHIPNNSEWWGNSGCLGILVGGKMKEIGTAHWLSPNTGATNESGFTGLPGGCRYGDGSGSGIGGFYGVGSQGNWWSTSEHDANNAHYFILNYGQDGVGSSYDTKTHGLSVRCIKD